MEFEWNDSQPIYRQIRERVVAMILDGGPTQVGIESTVLSLTGPQPLLLRLGMVSLHDLLLARVRNLNEERVRERVLELRLPFRSGAKVGG